RRDYYRLAIQGANGSSGDGERVSDFGNHPRERHGVVWRMLPRQTAGTKARHDFVGPRPEGNRVEAGKADAAFVAVWGQEGRRREAGQVQENRIIVQWQLDRLFGIPTRNFELSGAPGPGVFAARSEAAEYADL